MDPVTAMIVAKAAEAFGASFGEALGNGLSEWLFGAGNDNAKVQQKLDQIIDRIKVLDQRLSYLTSLVESLPAAIIIGIKTESVDDAYDFLTSSRWYMQNTPNYGPPTEAYAVQLLSSWQTIVRKESRPSKLLLITSWTEIVRSRLSQDFDDDIGSLLDEKQDVVRSAKDGYCYELDGLLAEARQILASEYFSNSEVTALSPFLIWSEAAPKLIRFCDADPEWPRFVRCSKIADEAWVKRQVTMVARLHVLREQIASRVANIGASIPVISLLEKYVETISAQDKAFVRIAFPSANEVSDELEWLPRSLAQRRALQAIPS